MSWSWAGSTCAEYSTGLHRALEQMATDNPAELADGMLPDGWEGEPGSCPCPKLKCQDRKTRDERLAELGELSADALATAAHDATTEYDTATDGAWEVYLPDGWTTVKPWDTCQGCGAFHPPGVMLEPRDSLAGPYRCSDCAAPCDGCGDIETREHLTPGRGYCGMCSKYGPDSTGVTG